MGHVHRRRRRAGDGGTTYLWFLDHEGLLEDPARWHGYYGDRPCWVFTHRELPAIPGADLRFVQGDVAPVHRAPVTLGAGAPLLPRHIESLRLREVHRNGQFAELTYDVVRGD